jgi:hypothetical protein
MAVTSHDDGNVSTAYWRNVGIDFRSFNTYETFSYPEEAPGTGLDALAANAVKVGQVTGPLLVWLLQANCLKQFSKPV